MEEKERYEIHIYDDICVDLYDNGVLDKSINDTYKLEELLNQQSKRLKELEKENKQLKDQVKKSYQEGLLQKQFDKDMEIQELKDKIEQLKQSQKQLAIEELEKLREYIVLNDEYDEEIGCNIIKTFDLIEDLADKIKSLKGEE